MTSETSYNASYAPYARWSVQQAPVPASTHNLPATIAASATVQTSLILTEGFNLISAGVTSTQSGVLSVQRYLDAGGTVSQGAPVTLAVTANVAANLDILDGKPFASFVLKLTNGSASVATISAFALLLQASATSTPDTGAALAVSAGNIVTDGSTAITTGGTAQNLFGGMVPSNGFAIYNPDPSNDLWVSDGATALANGSGSLRIAANGGGYETPPGYKPAGILSVVGAATGQKFTAKRW